MGACCCGGDTGTESCCEPSAACESSPACEFGADCGGAGAVAGGRGWGPIAAACGSGATGGARESRRRDGWRRTVVAGAEATGGSEPTSSRV